MTDIAIEFDGVTKSFGKNAVPAVAETSLCIKEGEFVTILGTSGSGKTTLLKMVNRIHEPTTGGILVQGEKNSDIPLNELRRKIGYVIQQIGLFPHMTVGDNIATVPKILKWDKQKIDDRVDFLLELIHLSPEIYRKRYPKQLSGGQQQRIGIARAMASDPTIMLMDEPFGAIDAITRVSLQEELISIQRKLNKTILFVTHDIEEALKLGDKIIIMNEGKVQQFDNALNILLNPANEFVNKLVQSEDVIKLLDYVQAKTVMVSPTHFNDLNQSSLSVSKEDNLKKVLSLMLQHHVDFIHVKEKEKLVGVISFEQLKLKDQVKQALVN